MLSACLKEQNRQHTALQVDETAEFLYAQLFVLPPINQRDMNHLPTGSFRTNMPHQPSIKFL